MTEPAIAARDVVKRFGALTALDAVTVTIRPGRLVALLGWNAAGKSTLFRLLAGLVEPDAGTITMFGHDIRQDRSGARKLVSYVPQAAGIDEFLSVEETLDLRADLCDMAGGNKHARMVELLHLIGLADSLHVRVSALPLEPKRRLGLACALIKAPRILLLDELTAGLDSLSRRTIFSIIRRLVEGGVTILWGTSAIDEAEHCDDLILLHEGRVIDQGNPPEFTARAKGHVRVIKPEGPRKHEAAAVLQGEPGVLDARIHGDTLRIIVDRKGRAISHAAPGGGEASRSVTPTLEDALIISLRDHATGPTTPSPRATRRRLAGGMLEVRGMRKCFGGRVALEGLSFTVAPGEIFGIAGPNGSGKSTVLQILGGSLRPTQGSIVIAKVGPPGAPPVAGATLGYMTQAFSLYGDLTVRQNLRFLAATRRMARGERSGRMALVAAECGLEPHLDMRAGDLTFAMRRRLALAAALLHDPDLLLLDEPSAGADPLTRRDLWHQIDAAAANGVAVVVASHLVEDADSCDRILLLSRGQAIATGTADELKTEAASVGGDGTTLEGAITALVLDWEKRSAA